MSDSPPFERLSSEGMRIVNDACDAFEQKWQVHTDGNELPSLMELWGDSLPLTATIPHWSEKHFAKR